MRDINLIPRKPVLEKAFIPLLAGTIGASVLAAVLISTFIVRYHGNADTQLAQIRQMKTRMEQLTASRQIDPRTVYFNTMNADLTKLKANRTNWVPVFEFLSQHVPPAARVVAMGVKERDKMTMHMEFADWKRAAEYVSVLQQSGFFQSVQVSGIEKQEKESFSAAASNPLPANANSVAGQGQNNPGMSVPAAPSATATAPKVLTQEEYIRSIQDGQKPSATSSDELLNELDWLMNRQVSKQQFQLELPEKPSQNRSESGEAGGIKGSSPFSSQELEAAKKSLEELKRTQIGRAAGSGSNVPSTQADQGNAAMPSGDLAVAYYNVSLELTLKPLSKR
ncbi:hypothetical protein PAESOLCIP111_04983 [Paenibacillus solanacearum]|uniref:Fimbrial assembly protein n=1 Tax=Paenibacillus solanacearum TaxID=2048548 RepID=A0A916K5A4_9BACL|nr:hypothetical protein [Paenibacillus solanacearum]CAG7645578.1 hypothetical protein PAESOLCIP111_04983 [Paenibacillus solanacearum]